MNLLLKNLRWRLNGKIITHDIRIRKGLFSNIGENIPAAKNDIVLSFMNHFICPGLINAHDHLEMNLYPRMGNPPYKNYTEWGLSINKQESPVKEIEKVNIEDRMMWGGIKNMVSGATTVVHHNPWRRLLSSKKFPTNVLKNYAWAHSPAFGSVIKKAFPSNPKTPFIIHAAEGVDKLALGEIDRLHEMGLLKSNTVLVHAIALTDLNITAIEEAGASVVWCPSSNFFLFNKTAPIDKLKEKINIAIGSDSTLTGQPTLLDEMQFAFQTKLASAEEIYKWVTLSAASIFNLPVPEINVNRPANFSILPANKDDYFENLIHSKSSQIEMVVVNGELRYCSESIANELNFKKYFANVNGVRKWFYCDVSGLKSRIRKKVGNAVDQNPLWNMID